jgi:hypothetical protein
MAEDFDLLARRTLQQPTVEGRTGGMPPTSPVRAARIASEQEMWRENFRQTSALIAEQILGWASLLGGITGLVLPSQILPAMLSANPTTFIIIGVGVLSGKKLAAILKAALGAL